MSRKSNNHYIGKIQTKDWLHNGYLNFVDILNGKIDREGQNKLFADKKIFPLEFENFLSSHIETPLGLYYDGKKHPNTYYPLYRAMWLLTYFQSNKTVTASYKGRKNIPDKNWDVMVKLGTASLSSYDDLITDQRKNKKKEILILNSDKNLFYNNKGLFPYIFYVPEKMIHPMAILCSPISKKEVVAEVFANDIPLIEEAHRKNPDRLRDLSISINPEKVVFDASEIGTNFKSEKELLAYVQANIKKIEYVSGLLSKIDEEMVKYNQLNK